MPMLKDCTVGHTETDEMGFGSSRERLGTQDLYCRASDGTVASPLEEPRTPRHLCEGVSDSLV